MVDREALTASLEAILLTASGPVAVTVLVETVGDAEIGAKEIEGVLESIGSTWDRLDSGIRLEKVAGGWRCVTPATLDGVLRSFHGIASRQRLSQAALEVLAIVAHRQPVTLPEINFIRGTNSASVVRTLLERKLLRLAGRKKVVGKPFLYRTSKEFLVHFGLERPEDLPDPEEMVKDETAPVD
jgi:segregation and condensation protein B